MFVVTFYSFKGGVGRTHAAVNVAWSFANLGLRVLLVDFDLEAPGLTYLRDLAPKSGERKGGVAELIADSWETKQTQDPKNYLYRPDGFRVPLFVMPAGAIGTLTFNKAFSQTREFFKAAFDNKQGAPGLTLFRDLRRAWESLQFDYVVIDSRTGLTDIGGVCTRLLPDLLVLFFGLGEQGLDGVKQVLDQVGRETLYGDRLDVLLAASMVPEGEEALRAERLTVVQQVLGRRPDFLFPIFPPLFLQEDIKHIQDPLSPLAHAYQALRDQIRKANKWDLHLRLPQARLRASGGNVGPLENLVHDLLSPDAEQLAPQSRWGTLSDAAVYLIQAPARDTESQRRAVLRGTSALRETLARIDRFQYKDLYASTLNNLAVALAHLPARDAEERAAYVREAVGYYREVLGLYAKDRDPEGWAMSLNNLATALRALPARDAKEKAAYVREAVGYYKKALEVYAEDRHLLDRAGTLNNLAAALTELPAEDAEERTRNLRDAVGHLKEACRIYTKDSYPVEWAMTSNNLAAALRVLPTQDTVEQAKNLRDAMGHYRKALEVYAKDRYPFQWATTLTNLANGLCNFPVRDPEERAGNVREAVGYYRKALEVHTKESYPLDWAMTMSNLATALRALPAPAEERERNLREAVAHHKEALKIYTEDRYPVQWATTLTNLANSVCELPTRDAEERARNLREAVEYYKKALEVHTKDRYPHLYAQTAMNLGVLLFNAGQTGEARPHLESAWALRALLPDQGESLKPFMSR